MANRDVVNRIDAHIASVGLQRCAIGHGDPTRYGIKLNRLTTSTGCDIGVLQNGATRHNTDVAGAIDHITAQSDVTGYTAGADEHISHCTDHATASKGLDAACVGHQNQFAAANQVVLHRVSLHRRTATQVNDGAIG